MLVVLMLIAALSALALVHLPHIWQISLQAQFQRNAQEIASVFATGKAAGVDFLVAGDKRATAQKVVDGDSPDSGVFSGKEFRAVGIDIDAFDGALRYLDLQGELLIYNSTGVP
jgi:hypothetical protein